MSEKAEFHPSPPVPMEDLLRVHAAEYIHRFTSGKLLDQDMRVIGAPVDLALLMGLLCKILIPSEWRIGRCPCCLGCHAPHFLRNLCALRDWASR